MLMTQIGGAIISPQRYRAGVCQTAQGLAAALLAARGASVNAFDPPADTPWCACSFRERAERVEPQP